MEQLVGRKIGLEGVRSSAFKQRCDALCFGALFSERDSLLRRKIDHDKAVRTSFCSILDRPVFTVGK